MALEEEAQICRLCGQCESIYIDVFGEEGTKRYLGLKIHTKINILIDERDPLPKAICVQCLGKLEFVCDFQEECLRTQQLLRDRFNWPSPTDVDEVKNEETPVSSVNNNSIEKNQNPPDKEEKVENVTKEVGQSPSPNCPSLAIVEPASIAIDREMLVENAQEEQHEKEAAVAEAEIPSATTTETPCNNLDEIQMASGKTGGTKNIPSEFDVNNVCRNAPIANRLRSHGSSFESNDSTTCQSPDKPQLPEEDSNMVQIPISALNKVLTTVANSENMQVTVKESTGVNGRNEDINFIVELRHKEKTDFVTVLAKVFPDQGSCMVDRGAIVKLLENQNGSEIRAIVDKIFNKSNSKVDEDEDAEAQLVAGRNPEDLFRMDGEEISVEENIEHAIVEKRSRYICRLCRKKYSRKDKCIVHVKTHLGIKQYLCTLCPAKFVCKSDVLKHIRSTHTNPRPFQCPKCPRRLRSKFDLTEHDNVHEGIKPYSCDECGLRYHHKVSLQMHAKSHLPSQNLACEYCGNVFPFRTRLLSHIASVHMKNRRNFRCHFCYNLYSSLSVLNDHIKSSHAATHVCEICGKEFKVKSKYKTHVLQHKNPRPFSCPVCNNKYASRTFLSEHLSKHQGLRKHVCQKCGATFAQASHLAAHRHVHGEKKYPCPDCGRRFNRQDNMKVHRKRHFKTAPSTKPKEKQKPAKPAVKDNAAPVVPIIEKYKKNALSSFYSAKFFYIKEDDEFSKKVCMRCIGTVEFVTDFHNKCHQTQRQLLLARAQSQKLADDDAKSDSESDKENSVPTNGLGRSRVTEKTSQAGGSIKDEENVTSGDINDCQDTESGIKQRRNATDIRSKRKSTRVENQLEKAKKIKREEDRELFDGETNAPKNTEYSKGRENPSEIRNTIDSKKANPIQRRKTASPWRRNPLANIVTRDGRGQVDSARLGRRTRKSGRRSDIPAEPPSTNAREKLGRSEREIPVQRNPGNKILVEYKPTEEAKIEKEESRTVKMVEKSTEDNPENENTVKNQNGRFSGATDDKGALHRSEHKLEVIKSEETSCSNETPLRATALAKTEELPSASSTVIIISMPEALSREARAESTAKSPRPGDEAGGRRSRRYAAMEERVADGTPEIICEEDDGKLASASLVRKTVIESVKNGETVLSSNKKKPEIKTSSRNDETTRQKSSSTVPEVLTQPLNSRNERTPKESNQSSGGDVESYRERRKKTVGLFGKLSELITEEQKGIIESLYTVNMAVVDDEEVYRNIKIFDKSNVKCAICGKTYPRMDKCQVHVWGHLNMKPYCCKSCDFVTLTVSNIRCHIRKRHLKIKPFQCNLCEKSYSTAVLLEEHINSHTGAKPYKCKLCDFATSNRQVLSYHKTTHKAVKDISCEVCGKKFFSNCRMRAHMIVHNKDRNLMCKLCSTYLCNAEALEKHYQKVHSRDYVCNVCGLRTKSRKALSNHENVHLAAKFRCPLCTNVYKSKHMLKEHLLKHQGIRKYKCELCHKSFAQQSHIAAHMSVHIGKRYPCPGCNKLFNRRDNMRIHTRRCDLFKSNPDAKSFWTHRTSTRSIRAMDGKPEKKPDAESTNESKTDEEKLETSLGQIRINVINDDKTDNYNSRIPVAESRDPRDIIREQRFEQFKSDEGKIFRFGEVEIFPLASSNAAVTVQNEGNAVITENVLQPECF